MAQRFDASANTIFADHEAASEPRLGGRARRGGGKGVLLLATYFSLPYRVLRCAAAAGAEVHVLGAFAARGLRASRHCRQYFDSNYIINGSRDEGLALEINCLARDLDIAMVLPGDPPSTRSLIACRDLLDIPTFPLPSVETFDLLNDKWSFTGLCGRLGVRCPASRFFADAEALAAAIAGGEIRFPAVAKPLSLYGNQGLTRLDDMNGRDQLSKINYRPIIVQDFIDGNDIGASVYCKSGTISAFIAHKYDFRRQLYSTFHHEGIYRDILKITESLQLDGVANFDMRLASDGIVYYLECNPRFFFKMDLSLLAGMNFVALGLAARNSDVPLLVADGTEVRHPRDILSSPGDWLRVRGRDFARLTHMYSDPLPHLLEKLRILDRA